MSKLYFGGPLDTIKQIIQVGFFTGQILRTTLLDAMIDARNSVGLNRRFRPVVLVIHDTNPNNTKETDQGLEVVKEFSPDVSEIFLVKIDFNSPQLVRVAGTIPPLSLMDIGTYSKIYSSKKLAQKA
ncbi:hypothetical protein [Desulforamulus aquiferis]|uniref:Uncharacterized protein n=1 Tax=Desulforamulus aquiferis TaxID=1397668 RepID=A0AAW7ZIN8_9FIRM|nr:hypothetical protein [Desulforamulus aquiferis]MDO7789009.1 hypothetical protein [Desulforamulus aquiferis]